MAEISIIVPIYNIKESTLKNNIQNLINQTFTDVEIILIDDGSNNNALKICNSFKTDKRISVFTKPNGGVSTARNLGLSHATGKWIMFVDGDDYTSIHTAEKLLAETDDETDIIASACTIHIKNYTEDVHFLSKSQTFKTEEEKLILYKQLMKGITGQPGKRYYTAIGVPWGKLYRKSFLDRNNLKFDESLKRMQDNIFNMRAFKAAKTIKYTDQCLYQYDYTHMNDYKKIYSPQVKDYFTCVVREREKEMKELGLYENKELKEYYLNEKLRLLAHIEMRVPLNKRNGFSYIKRCHMTKEIAELPEFNELYTTKNKAFAFKHGLNCIGFYTLTKLKMWWILALFSK